MSLIENLFMTALGRASANGQGASTSSGGAADDSSKIHNYNHGGKLYIDDKFSYAPKLSHLYHVKFDINPEYQTLDNNSLVTAGMLVKSVGLPKFTVDSKIHNAYNRPNIVQNKIKYDPVSITFHDDNSDVVLDLWRDYYTYYYRDSDYYNNDDTLSAAYTAEHKYATRRTTGWGYTLKSPSGKQQMLRAIRVYSLHSGHFTEYVLINPIITSFQHGEHRQNEANTMEHTMSVTYESILYFKGQITESTVPGFADLHYDRSQSPIASGAIKKNTAYAARNRPYGARGILNAGGILDSADQVITDIGNGNYEAAALKAWKSYNSNKGVNLTKLLKAEAQDGLIKAILPARNPNSNMSIPTASRLSQGSETYQNQNQGLTQNNSNMSGISGLVTSAKQYLSKNNISPPSAVVSNGGDISYRDLPPPASARPGMPLDDSAGKPVYPTVNFATGYSANYMNNPPDAGSSNQGENIP